MRAKISLVNILVASHIFVLSFALLFSPLDASAIGTFNIDDYYTRVFSPVIRYCTQKITNLPSGWTQVDKCSYSGTTSKYWTTSGPNRLENNGSFLFDSISGIEVVNGTQVIPVNSYLAIPFLITSGAQELNFNSTAGVRYLIGSDNFRYLDVISTDFEDIDSGNYRMTIYARARMDIPVNKKLAFASAAVSDYIFTGDLNTLYTYNFMWFRGQTRSGIIASNAVVFFPKLDNVSSNADLDDVVDSLGSILGSVNSIKNSINSMSSNQSDILSALEDVQSATIQANSDANDRYEDEKDTINDSRDEAQDSADSMDTSGFSFGNPLSTWFGMFSNNQCVSIPKLKAWLHSTENQVCSPWSSDVRSNLTPVASFLSIMVAFGLLIHWLKGDSDVGLENT